MEVYEIEWNLNNLNLILELSNKSSEKTWKINSPFPIPPKDLELWREKMVSRCNY